MGDNSFFVSWAGADDVGGSDQNETVVLFPGTLDVDGGIYKIHVINVEDITLDAGAGDNDRVTMAGSADSNRLYSYADYARLTDTSGDRAYLYDSSGDDKFDEAFFENDKYQGGSLTDAAGTEPGTYENLVKYFDLVYARSTDRNTNDTIAVDNEELLTYRLIRMGTWL